MSEDSGERSDEIGPPSLLGGEAHNWDRRIGALLLVRLERNLLREDAGSQASPASRHEFMIATEHHLAGLPIQSSIGSRTNTGIFRSVFAW
jgi:hypothetical protein